MNSFFFDSIPRDPPAIFHIWLILLMIIGVVMYAFRGRKMLNILDAVGLYLPIVQIIGSLFRLLFGCFQGKPVSINIYGFFLKFMNPIPLYAIIADVCLFFFLKRFYVAVYKDEWSRKCFSGVVFTLYLMIYSAVRIVLNVFEKDYPFFLNLTLTQVFMGGVLLISIFILLALFYFHPVLKTNSCPVNDDVYRDINSLKRLFFPAGLTVFYLMTIFLIYYLTRIMMAWKWPIQPVDSLTDAYSRIFLYMPVMLIPAFALKWLKKNKEPIRPWFKLGRFSILFFIGLLVSIYYSLELLILKHPGMRDVVFWPPVIIISIMNAFSEEIMYRLAFYRAVINADFSKWTALAAQSVMYSLIHFMVIGGVLGIFSLIYGLLLGLIVQRSRSISQAIICHFIIDIGCIGMPILRV